MVADLQNPATTVMHAPDDRTGNGLSGMVTRLSYLYGGVMSTPVL
jgi:hypothetical protein